MAETFIYDWFMNHNNSKNLVYEEQKVEENEPFG